jgi:hypothetical protein
LEPVPNKVTLEEKQPVPDKQGTKRKQPSRKDRIREYWTVDKLEALRLAVVPSDGLVRVRPSPAKGTSLWLPIVVVGVGDTLGKSGSPTLLVVHKPSQRVERIYDLRKRQEHHSFGHAKIPMSRWLKLLVGQGREPTKWSTFVTGFLSDWNASDILHAAVAGAQDPPGRPHPEETEEEGKGAGSGCIDDSSAAGLLIRTYRIVTIAPDQSSTKAVVDLVCRKARDAIFVCK